MSLNKTRSSKKEAGFTLVEVIVVAVIVLILSAVAIPLYNGYVNDARQDVVDNLAETAAAAANAHWRKTGAPLTTGQINPNKPPLKLFFDSNKHTVTVNSKDVEVEDKHGNTSKKDYRE